MSACARRTHAHTRRWQCARTHAHCTCAHVHMCCACVCVRARRSSSILSEGPSAQTRALVPSPVRSSFPRVSQFLCSFALLGSPLATRFAPHLRLAGLLLARLPLDAMRLRAALHAHVRRTRRCVLRQPPAAILSPPRRAQCVDTLLVSTPLFETRHSWQPPTCRRPAPPSRAPSSAHPVTRVPSNVARASGPSASRTLRSARDA